MSGFLRELDALLDRAEDAALALDGEALLASVSSLGEHAATLHALNDDDSARAHVERRLLRLRGLCGGLSDVLGETLGIEEKYGAHGEKVGGPSRSSTRGYI